MTYSVSQRTREIGIRKAMGADTRDIVALIGRRVLPVLAIGLLLGLAAALGFSPLLETQLWGITARDPATYAAAALLLVFVTLGACLHPLRRALRIDPTAALRME
jgi:putative ABC transport system permease protein